MKRLLVALAAACPVLAACGGLLKSSTPPEIAYRPTLEVGTALSPTLDAVLTVARPEAGPGLDGDAIVVGLPSARLDRVAGARFAASVPELLEAELVAALGARGGWRAVASDHSAFSGTYLLQTEIRHFSADYAAVGTAPVVRVVIHAELGRVRDRHLVATVDAVGEAPASADRQAAIVAAFGTAMGQAVTMLGSFAHAAALAERDRPAASR